MAGTATPNACTDHMIRSAFKVQENLIAHNIDDAVYKSDTYAIDKIKQGESVYSSDDSRTLMTAEAFQAPVKYTRDMKSNPGEMILGTQSGQANCGGGTAKFEVQINKTPIGQCDRPICTVDIGQGFRTRDYADYWMRMRTPIRCISDLRKFKPQQVKKFFEQERRSIGIQGLDSLDQALIEIVTERGEANCVVLPSKNGGPVLTSDGWAPGNDVRLIQHASLPFLENYRREIATRVSRKEGNKADSYMLEIEMTRDAWYVMSYYDLAYRNSQDGVFKGLGGNIRLTTDDFKVIDQGRMKGRSYAIWNNIKVIFNDTPIRGFLKPTGQSASGNKTWKFVRVYPLMNTPGEEGGLVAVRNPDYYGNTVRCDNFEYPILELIPHIHRDSFVRHPLNPPVSPKGVVPHGNQFQVKLLDGAWLSSEDCTNYGDDKYGYFLQHEMRVRDVFPEFSGFIIHRPKRIADYDIVVDEDPYVIQSGTPTAVLESGASCDDPFQCKSCGEAPQNCTDADNLVTLTPSGEVNAGYYGPNSGLPDTVRVKVERSANCANAEAQVTYRIVGNTAINCTHYRPVDAQGNVAPEMGTLSWGVGESGAKEILIRIIGALPKDQPAATLTVELLAETGCTIDGTQTLEIAIQNHVP